MEKQAANEPVPLGRGQNSGLRPPFVAPSKASAERTNLTWIFRRPGQENTVSGSSAASGSRTGFRRLPSELAFKVVENSAQRTALSISLDSTPRVGSAFAGGGIYAPLSQVDFGQATYHSASKGREAGRHADLNP